MQQLLMHTSKLRTFDDPRFKHLLLILTNVNVAVTYIFVDFFIYKVHDGRPVRRQIREKADISFRDIFLIY